MTDQPADVLVGGERVARLVPTRSDEAVAAELKTKLRAAGEQVCAVLTEARAAGLMISWQVGWDAAGHAYVQQIDAVKPL